MNITPEEFLKEIKNGKSEKDLNRLENPYFDNNDIKNLIRYGHTLNSAKEYLSTDFTNGFTICKNCGSFYHLGKGFTKHLSNGCVNCEGTEKHYTYWHKGNNEPNYKTSPRLMCIMFDDGMHYIKDKLQINHFKNLL